jgi:uncharacterized protein YcbX
MVAGTVVEVHRYPVKSMQGESLDGADVDARGITGDRAWGVVDEATGKVLSAKREPRLLRGAANTTAGGVVVTLPSGACVLAGDPDASAALSAWLDRPVRLEAAGAANAAGGIGYEMQVSVDDPASPLVEIPCPPGTFFDLAAMHVLTTASLRAMQARYPEGGWAAGRFRPSLLVDMDGEEFAEDAWVGQAVTAGSVGLTPFMPTVRCVVPTRAWGDLPADLGLVKAVNKHHGASLGIYAAVSSPGRVAVGDTIG